MPTYDYECIACKHTFELFQKMTDKQIKKCPQCKKNKLKRLIGSGIGIIFKGSGFYETDYKRKQDKSQDLKATQKSSAEGKKESSTQAKTEKNISASSQEKTKSTASDSGKEKGKNE